MTRWWGPRGVRASVTMAFAVLALFLSAALASGTYFSARHLLVEQRERTALRQAFADAALVRDSLRTPENQVSDVLGSIAPPAGATMYVHRAGSWYSSSLDQPGERLTAPVRATVADGSVGLAWSSLTEPSSLVVGIPLPAVEAEYYEVSVAEELDGTLRTLALALGVGAALTTLAGGLLGRALSRRALAPLLDVTGAAVRVSVGDLDTRLRETDDPDLSVLVGAFNHMVDALDERIRRDARFAADVSHELRTPVTTLSTSLTLLQRSPGLGPQAQSAVRLMADELARFRRALEDLLTLGRLDASVNEAELLVTDARELARQALAVSGRPAHLLTTECHPGRAPLVSVDRSQMLRVLTNLFDNADVHGGGLARVTVVDQGHHVELRVADEGPGVPVADRERIFERFARSGRARAGTGSGLGLSIVAQTVRNHGGGVWCADHVTRGAEFVVRLPRADPGAATR